MKRNLAIQNFVGQAVFEYERSGAIFSFDIVDALFADIVGRFVASASAMRADGWWWAPPGMTNKAIRRRLLREALRVRLSRQAAAASG